MHLTFKNPGIDYMLDSIMEFQSDELTPFWFDSLYYFYPQLDKQYSKSLSFAKRNDYIKDTLKLLYKDLEKNIDQKLIDYSLYWNSHEKQITDAFSDAFQMDCSALFPDLCCYISMNPISPRFLRKKNFEVFYMNSEKGAVGLALHEITHFLWFHMWHQQFHDSYDEYESPSLKWILSEMVVEPILSDPRLQSINPYFPREEGGCIYPYFFDMKVNNLMVMDVIHEMYQTQKIAEFMKTSYEFCEKHEAEMRKHIENAESASLC